MGALMEAYRSMTTTTVPGFGIQLATNDPLRLGVDVPALAREAEDAGFDSLWIGDHLAFHCPILECVVALAAAGATTSRIRLGFGVLLLALRPVAWVAKQVSSLQVLTHDRILLGVGVGGEYEPEFTAVDVPVNERGRRTDRALAALDDLLQGRPGVDPVTGNPIPALTPHGAMPPIWVGGRKDAALRRAARYGDGWWGIWLDPARAERTRERLAEHAEAAGRPVPRLGTTIFVNVSEDREAARAESKAWLEAQYQMSFEKIEHWVAFGPAGHVAERIAALRAAGVEDFAAIVTAAEPARQYEALMTIREQL
jgi:alkanesulfonate monooxygenase SsuD/methylene tetrahydromethanopterin reductase-like flavin-dependent oxidoreductase (luciferase family)